MRNLPHILSVLDESVPTQTDNLLALFSAFFHSVYPCALPPNFTVRWMAEQPVRVQLLCRGHVIYRIPLCALQ